MSTPRFDCVFLGLSITSTWGNGHATTYRALLKELARRGHRCTFLERNVPWYEANRELEKLPYCDIELYGSLGELKDRFASLIKAADVVVTGSYVPEGIAVGRWITSLSRNLKVFYDIDTPVTLANLAKGKCEYISLDLYSKYNLYLSFTGGPTLTYIEQTLGSPCARALYCSVDPALYYPEQQPLRWEIAYLGTYAADRQPALEKLLLTIARRNGDHRFAVIGPQYPKEIDWPRNVERIEHLPANRHRWFYNSQKFALNLTRKDMIRAGYSPSVRLFEAAACGIPILSDNWPGLRTILTPPSEILLVPSVRHLSSYLQMGEAERQEIGAKARQRVLQCHSSSVRAEEFEKYVVSSLEQLSCTDGRSQTVMKQSPAAAFI